MCIISVHLDRSSNSLLKGKLGTILCWELSKKIPAGDKNIDLKRVPKCVYVQYYELDDMAARVPCKWKIGDLSPGVYPVTPITRTWLLGTDNKVSRFQLPLIPMYGRTAYSMQGRTLSKGKIDLTMSSPMDPTTGYVAMSRFRSTSHVLIMQPFDLKFYRQRPTLEPEMFIQYNRMRSVERLDSDRLHALFDSYTTKSERKKRKNAEERVTSKKVVKNDREEHHVHYDYDKRHKRHEKEYVPSPKKQPPPQAPTSSTQKRSAPSQTDSPNNVIRRSMCNGKIDASGKLRKLPKKQRTRSYVGKTCPSHK